MAHFPSFSHPPRLSTVTLGELHKLSRMLHAVAVAAGSLPDNPANPTEVMVFEDIAEHPNTTIMDISRRTHLAQSRVSHLVYAMIDHGSVTCTPDPHDKRRKLLTVPQQLLSTFNSTDTDDAISTALHTIYPALSNTAINDVLKHLHALSRYLSNEALNTNTPGS